MTSQDRKAKGEQKAPELEMPPEGTEVPFGSNAVRLTGRQWCAAVAIVLLICFFMPRAWALVEPFNPGASYRVPYSLSNDYWLYSRWCRKCVAEGGTLVIGDSVIWGEYVSPDATLSAHLAKASGEPYANLGLNGIHPAAMEGLVAYYARAVSGQRVVLHFNPLWMSSQRHDLRTEKEFRFNHPRLVPQFFPDIPCYKDPRAERIGIVAERYVPLRAWTNHLSVAYLDNMDPAAWAKENPCTSPFSVVTLRLPEPVAGDSGRHALVPWYEGGMKQTAFAWVDPDTSLQWLLFKRTARTLLRRGNRVFVLVGPFNEHMIAPESMPAYAKIKTSIQNWLTEEGIDHWVADLLPSELYADASHPLDAGYQLLARRILQGEAYRRFQSGE